MKGDVQKEASEIWSRVFEPLARRLAFDLGSWSSTAEAIPVVLFLGNHSSGKSSFINHLLDQEIQATGLAPTDDSFTLLTWGEHASTVDGPTITSHPQLGLRDLSQLGPAFTSKLRLKTAPHELLRAVTLVDSPGMIDAVGAANTRGYDFPAAVRVFAERADLILFFFDPDKPGTTAESVYILTHTLAGLGYKLLLILNKVDQCTGFRDFARTYGTLCWNLAKAIPTKDIPHISTCYVPVRRGSGPAPTSSTPGLPLVDFDVARAEILEEIRRAPMRRSDNLVTELLQRGGELRVHAAVCQEVAREYRRLRLQWLGALAGTVLLAGLAGWLAWESQRTSTRFWVVATSILAIGVAWGMARWQAARFRARLRNTEFLDGLFNVAHEGELALKDRADLRAIWAGMGERSARAIQRIGPARLALMLSLGRQLKRVQQALTQEIPALRRNLGERQAELPLPGGDATAKDRGIRVKPGT